MRTPTAVVLALLAMQPRLEAEESVAEVNRLLYGTGHLKEQDAAAMARRWSKASRPDGQPEPKANPGALTALGFAVKKIPRKKKA